MPKMWVISDSNSVKVETFEAEKEEKDRGKFTDQDEAVKAIKKDPEFKHGEHIIAVVLK